MKKLVFLTNVAFLVSAALGMHSPNETNNIFFSSTNQNSPILSSPNFSDNLNLPENLLYADYPSFTDHSEFSDNINPIKPTSDPNIANFSLSNLLQFDKQNHLNFETILKEKNNKIEQLESEIYKNNIDKLTQQFIQAQTKHKHLLQDCLKTINEQIGHDMNIKEYLQYSKIHTNKLRHKIKRLQIKKTQLKQLTTQLRKENQLQAVSYTSELEKLRQENSAKQDEIQLQASNYASELEKLRQENETKQNEINLLKTEKELQSDYYAIELHKLQQENKAKQNELQRLKEENEIILNSYVTQLDKIKQGNILNRSILEEIRTSIQYTKPSNNSNKVSNPFPLKASDSKNFSFFDIDQSKRSLIDKTPNNSPELKSSSDQSFESDSLSEYSVFNCDSLSEISSNDSVCFSDDLLSKKQTKFETRKNSNNMTNEKEKLRSSTPHNLSDNGDLSDSSSEYSVFNNDSLSEISSDDTDYFSDNSLFGKVKVSKTIKRKNSSNISNTRKKLRSSIPPKPSNFETPQSQQNRKNIIKDQNLLTYEENKRIIKSILDAQIKQKICKDHNIDKLIYNNYKHMISVWSRLSASTKDKIADIVQNNKTSFETLGTIKLRVNSTLNLDALVNFIVTKEKTLLLELNLDNKIYDNYRPVWEVLAREHGALKEADPKYEYNRKLVHAIVNQLDKQTFCKENGVTIKRFEAFKTAINLWENLSSKQKDLIKDIIIHNKKDFKTDLGTVEREQGGLFNVNLIAKLILNRSGKQKIVEAFGESKELSRYYTCSNCWEILIKEGWQVQTKNKSYDKEKAKVLNIILNIDNPEYASNFKKQNPSIVTSIKAWKSFSKKIQQKIIDVAKNRVSSKTKLGTFKTGGGSSISLDLIVEMMQAKNGRKTKILKNNNINPSLFRVYASYLRTFSILVQEEILLN